MNREFTKVGAEIGTFDVVFLDPPYDLKDPEVSLARAASATAAGGRLIYEHSRRSDSPVEAGACSRTRVVLAGDSALSFYTCLPPASPSIQDPSIR